MRFIDLSQPLSTETLTYPGDQGYSATPQSSLAEQGYVDHVVRLGTHCGTHIDAPAHMIGAGATVEELPLDRFSAPGVVIDARQGISLGAVNKLKLRAGSAVLFWTGMSQHFQNPAYFTNYPDVPEDVARALVGRHIALVGFDAASPDHAPFPVHKIFLGAGIPIVENLTNLQMVSGASFRFHAFPLRVQLDGIPVRAVAELM